MTEDHDESSEIDFIKEKYRIVERAGEGTFSTVYKCVDVSTSSQSDTFVAIKAITRTSSPARIVDELSFLRELGGKNNTIQLLNCYRHEDQICAVFPYFESINFRDFLLDCTLKEIRFYLYNLLVAVDHCHSSKIIHRDIKPSNFLYNRNQKRGVLIDFGLAQYERQIKIKEVILEDKSNTRRPSILFFNSTLSKVPQPPGYYIGDTRPAMRAQRAGTRGFRAPEILFRYAIQSLSIDIWSVGVIFLLLCTKQYPFFHSVDDTDAIVEIATIYGHDEMRNAAKHYERVWKSNLGSIPSERISFEKLIESLNPGFVLPLDGYDLLYQMLELIAEKRITAKDALNHPFSMILTDS